MKTRIERDSMGEMPVLAEALYGASTQRAVLNFPVSGSVVPVAIIHAYGLIKWAAAKTNAELGLLPAEKAALIETAALEVAQGQLDTHFVVDVYQTGSGTSTNMNANEVISNRICQMVGTPIGSKEPVHPNNDVNMGQSSNDTFPSALHLAVAQALDAKLIPVLDALHASLVAKQKGFWEVLKIGRTHLMDATPVRLGQEFGGYARQLELAIGRARHALAAVMELPLGGTAVGTGLNCHPDFPKAAIALLAQRTCLPFREAVDHFEAQSAKDALVEVSGQIKTIATSAFKIANDLRWLGSGPQCGLGELALPATQPGSSIMPGKVNPVMCESVMQVCARVIGNDLTVTWSAANGNLELNVMMPVMGAALLESIELLANSLALLRERCVDGLQANEERCRSMIEHSLAMVTALNSRIGYDKAAEIAKLSAATGRTVRSICSERLEELGLTAEELAEALDPAAMCAPNPAMVGAGGG